MSSSKMLVWLASWEMHCLPVIFHIHIANHYAKRILCRVKALMHQGMKSTRKVLLGNLWDLGWTRLAVMERLLVISSKRILYRVLSGHSWDLVGTLYTVMERLLANNSNRTMCRERWVITTWSRQCGRQWAVCFEAWLQRESLSDIKDLWCKRVKCCRILDRYAIIIVYNSVAKVALLQITIFPCIAYRHSQPTSKIVLAMMTWCHLGFQEHTSEAGHNHFSMVRMIWQMWLRSLNAPQVEKSASNDIVSCFIQAR